MSADDLPPAHFPLGPGAGRRFWVGVRRGEVPRAVGPTYPVLRCETEENACGLSVRDYLIRAHNKVIAHCRQVLQGSYLSERERMRVHKNLAAVEAEIEDLNAYDWLCSSSLLL